MLETRAVAKVTMVELPTLVHEEADRQPAHGASADRHFAKFENGRRGVRASDWASDRASATV